MTPQVIAKLPEGNNVHGLAIVHEELCLVRDKTPAVETYSLNRFSLQRRLPVQGLRRPCDMVSSARHSCLYIADNKNMSKSSRSAVWKIYRVEFNGITTCWSISEEPLSISVSQDECNVIVCSIGKVVEYTTKGSLVRDISNEFISATHIFQSMQNQFVYISRTMFQLNERSCINIVNDGHIIKSYGGTEGPAEGELNTPSRLAVDKDGYIFVANQSLNRILILSPSLTFVNELLSRNDKNISHVDRLCLDEVHGLLIVTQHGDQTGMTTVLKVKYT